MKDAAGQMKDDLRQGTHVAYLIKKGTFKHGSKLEKKNVLARVYLKPHNTVTGEHHEENVEQERHEGIGRSDLR